MPPSKQFTCVRSRQTRLYTNVSEDRMELLLDRFRSSLKQDIDWVGVSSALFATIASFIGLWDAWRGAPMQIALLIATSVFGAIVSFHIVSRLMTNRKNRPMTNEEFLAKLVEEIAEENERQAARMDKAAVTI